MCLTLKKVVGGRSILKCQAGTQLLYNDYYRTILISESPRDPHGDTEIILFDNSHFRRSWEVQLVRQLFLFMTSRICENVNSLTQDFLFLNPGQRGGRSHTM